MEPRIQSILFYFLALLCVILDLVLGGYYLSAHFFFSRCFFYTTVASTTSTLKIIIAGVCALMPLFLITGLLGADLVVMVPLGYLLYQITHLIHLDYLLKALAVFSCFLIHTVLIDYGVLGLWMGISSLIVHFIAILIMVYLSER